MHLSKYFAIPFSRQQGVGAGRWSKQARACETHAVCNLNTVLQMYLLSCFSLGAFQAREAFVSVLYASQLITNEQSQSKQIWLLLWIYWDAEARRCTWKNFCSIMGPTNPLGHASAWSLVQLLTVLQSHEREQASPSHPHPAGNIMWAVNIGRNMVRQGGVCGNLHRKAS